MRGSMHGLRDFGMGFDLVFSDFLLGYWWLSVDLSY